MNSEISLTIVGQTSCVMTVIPALNLKDNAKKKTNLNNYGGQCTLLTMSAYFFNQLVLGPYFSEYADVKRFSFNQPVRKAFIENIKKGSNSSASVDIINGDIINKVSFNKTAFL